MHDFDVKRCSRRCAKTDRELRPGETIYSVLVAEGADVKRLDYAEDAWQEPPGENKELVAWWKSQLPGGGNRMQWAPNDVLLDYFQQLENDEARADVRFVMSLLLIRRRIMRLEDSQTDETGKQVLVVYCPRNETEYRVTAVVPSEERATEIQSELSQLLTTSGT